MVTGTGLSQHDASGAQPQHNRQIISMRRFRVKLAVGRLVRVRARPV